MTAAIREALIKLDIAIDGLEGSMGGLEEALNNGGALQRDIFNDQPSNQNVSAQQISRKLDLAIRKVEAILKDGTNG